MSIRRGVSLSARKSEAPAEPIREATPARPARGSGRVLALACAVLVLGAGLITASAGSRTTAPDAAGAAPTAPAGYFAAPGLVESSGGLRDLAFLRPGRIRSVLPEEGDRVQEGQVLAEIDNDECLASVAAARAEVGVAEGRLRVLEKELTAGEERAHCERARLRANLERMQAGARTEELERMRADVKAAEIEWKRRVNDADRYASHPTVSSEQERVMTRGLAEITRAQYEAAAARLRELEAGARKEDLTMAATQLQAAEIDCARLEGTRAARLAVAQQELDLAQARQRTAEAELAKTRLIAPLDGIVVWRFRHPGETVGILPPERVLTVASLADLRVRADVDEADFVRIKPGQKALVSADAFGSQTFPGRVERVSCAAGEKRFSTGEAKERRDVKIVETIVVFEQPPPLKLNLRVTVRFEPAKTP